MRVDRGFEIDVGSKVRFQYSIPIKGSHGKEGTVDKGTIMYIDGAYIGISCNAYGVEFIAERYPNEILELL